MEMSSCCEIITHSLLVDVARWRSELRAPSHKAQRSISHPPSGVPPPALHRHQATYQQHFEVLVTFALSVLHGVNCFGDGVCGAGLLGEDRAAVSIGTGSAFWLCRKICEQCLGCGSVADMMERKKGAEAEGRNRQWSILNSRGF